MIISDEPSIDEVLVVIGEQPNIQILVEDLQELKDSARFFHMETEAIESDTEVFGNADLVQLTIDFIIAVLAAGAWDGIKGAVHSAERRGRISITRKKKPPID